MPSRKGAAIAAAFFIWGICMPRELNAAAIALNSSTEACRLVAYDDLRPDRILRPGDPVAGRLTIGWGHTGPDVQIGMSWTQLQADQAHVLDLTAIAAMVEAAVSVPLTDNQFGALVDFAFNVGIGAFRRSHLLQLVNRGRLADVPAELRLWVYAGRGLRRKPLAGLVERRKREVALWLAPPVPMSPPEPAAPAPLPRPVNPTLLQRLLAWLR